MSTFVFKAMDLAGAPMRGQVDADSKQAVSDQLKARGLIILDIAEKHRSREINLDAVRARSRSATSRSSRASSRRWSPPA